MKIKVRIMIIHWKFKKTEEERAKIGLVVIIDKERKHI